LTFPRQDGDALAELAAGLGLPAASLASLRGIEEERLRELSAAIRAAIERRRVDVDAELQRAFGYRAAVSVIRIRSGRDR
jgi:hypothetical protein